MFVSGLLALCLLWVQDNLEDRDQRRQEQAASRTRAEEARQRQDADRRSLQLTIGMARNLRGIDLRDRRLDGFYLASKDLHQAQLEGATARRANLTDAKLVDVPLTGTDFRDATMVGAKIVGRPARRDAEEQVREWLLPGPSDRAAEQVVSRTDFSYADLTHASLKRLQGESTTFTRANMERATLEQVFLSAPVFRRARLIRVRLRLAFLADADFRDAQMYGARLRGAMLGSADLRGADMCGADLRNANLRSWGEARTNLRGADLRGADLRGVSGLKSARLDDARFDASTRWPRRFPVLASGAVDMTRHNAFNSHVRARKCRRGNTDDYWALLEREGCLRAGPRPLEPPLPEPVWMTIDGRPAFRDPILGLKARPRSRPEYACEPDLIF